MHIPLFAKVEPAKLKLLAFTSERLEYLSGTSCFTRATTAMPPISSWRAGPTSWSTRPMGAVKVATLGKNDIIGEITVLCDVPPTATVVAHGKLGTLRVSKDGFFHLSPSFRRSASR